MANVSDFHIHGFDVSHYQSDPFDFTQGERKFGIIKASESATYVDPLFSHHRDQAHAQGMVAVGMYHFARPNKNTASIEAHHFLATLGARRAGEFAVLDYEVDPWSESWIVEFINIVKAAGWPVMFYTYRAMLMAHPHANVKNTGAELWVASYSSTTPVTDWPWMLNQHTDGQGSVSGNDGSHDCSVFHTNDINDLIAFVGAQPQPNPPTGDNEMTNDEHNMLVDNHNRLANLEGTDNYKNIVLADLQTKVNDLEKKVGTGGGASALSDADVAKVAKAVADLLATRMQS